MTATKPPTTAWGALLKAADLIDQHGLAQGHGNDLLDAVRAGKLCPYLAIREALWPDRDEPIVDGGIPRDTVSGRPYWAAARLLEDRLGGWPAVVEFSDNATDPGVVTAEMRAAAGRRPA